MGEGPLDEFKPKLYSAMDSTGGESSKGPITVGESSKGPSSRSWNFVLPDKSSIRISEETMLAYSKYTQSIIHPDASNYYGEEIKRLRSLPSLTPQQKAILDDYLRAIKKACDSDKSIEAIAKNAGLTLDNLSSSYKALMKELEIEKNKKMWSDITAIDRNRGEANSKACAESLMDLKNSKNIPENVSKVTSDSSLSNPKGKGKE